MPAKRQVPAARSQVIWMDSQKYNFMTNPYEHPSLQRDDTMYLSTISKFDFPSRSPFYRESSFLQKDIPGTAPKVHIPQQATSSNFQLSTFVEPIPDRNKHIQKSSNPLFIDDIDGARPKCTEFKSKRIVDPLCPKYLLPSSSEIVIDPGRKFIRDTLDTKDISKKHSETWMNRGKQILKQTVEGSYPSKLTKDVKAVARLDVKDINKDMIFQSTRHTNPLQPSYLWRDDDDKRLNEAYGEIKGAEVRRMHPMNVNKPSLSLNTKDIEGTQVNSFYSRSHFLDKRRQFRNYMVTQDIEKAQVSSLKKGIATIRQTNPLMPNYQFPGATETSK